MSLTWNDNLAGGDAWNDRAYLNLFMHAIWERQSVARRALQTWTENIPIALTKPANPLIETLTPVDHTGTNVLFGTIAAGSVVQRLPHYFQATAVQLVKQFLRAPYDPNTFSDLSLHGTAYYDYLSACAAIGKPNGLTRKYPRELGSLAATTYTDGSAIADGHKARSQADGLTYVRKAGAWTRQADVYDPDVVTSYFTTEPWLELMRGDYVGSWIFNETRDLLNLCRYTEASVYWTDWNAFGTVMGRSAVNSDMTSYGAAVASAQTNWTSSYVNVGYYPEMGRLGATAYTTTSDQGEVYGTSWKAGAENFSGAPFVDRSGILPDVVCYATLWIRARKIDFDDIFGIIVNVYDDQGTGLEEDVWTYWTDAQLDPGDPRCAGPLVWPAVDQIPPNWGADEARGFVVDQSAGSYDWTFTERAN